MNHISWKRLGSGFILSAILAAGMLVRPSEHAAAVGTAIPTVMSDTTIAVQAPATPVKVGDAFDIPVTLTTDTPSWGAQFEIRYDKDLLEITGVEAGGFYRDWAAANGATGMTYPKPAADNAKGLIPTTAFYLVGAKFGQGPSGSGTLAILHAKALKEGSAVLALSNLEVDDAGIHDGTTTSLGGVKAQNGIVSIGGGAAVQPTAGLFVPTPIPAQNLAAQPTIARRSLSDANKTGIPWTIILLALLGVAAIGGVVYLVTRKK